jgi:hypothetical protein
VLHLILDETLVEGSAGSSRPVLKTLRVPSGVSYIRPKAPLGSLLTGVISDGNPMIEPLTGGPQPRLLLLTPPAAGAATVNGRTAPCVCLLRVGDQWLLDDSRLLHVTAFDTPRIGPAIGLEDGVVCPVCRTPFSQDGRVFTCPCGRTLHYDDDDVTEDRRLLCVLLASECSNCRRPINLNGGFRYVPDLG